MAVAAQVPAPKKYKPYDCAACTFRNENNPGPTCEVCMSAAPESALIDTSAEQKAKEAEEAKLKEQSAEERKEKDRLE